MCGLFFLNLIWHWNRNWKLMIWSLLNTWKMLHCMLHILKTQNSFFWEQLCGLHCQSIKLFRFGNVLFHADIWFCSNKGNKGKLSICFIVQILKIASKCWLYFLFCNKCNNMWNAGPILESKGMGVIFQKTGKIFENFSKNVQN